MVVAAIITVAFHWNLSRKYSTILKFAPWSLVAQAHDQWAEKSVDVAEQARTAQALENQRQNPQDGEREESGSVEERNEFLQ